MQLKLSDSLSRLKAQREIRKMRLIRNSFMLLGMCRKSICKRINQLFGRVVIGVIKSIKCYDVFFLEIYDRILQRTLFTANTYYPTPQYLFIYLQFAHKICYSNGDIRSVASVLFSSFLLCLHISRNLERRRIGGGGW